MKKTPLVLFCVFAFTAWGVPLPIGTTFLPGTTEADRPELAGVIVEDTMTVYSFSGTAGEFVTGVIQTRVVRSTLDGTLDFYWRIIPDDPSNAGILALRIGSFGDFPLDGDWRADWPGEVAPDSALNFGGGFVNFLFIAPGVSPPDSSRWFFLDTPATAYTMDAAFDLLCAPSGCISEPFSTFGPAVDSDGDGVPDREDLCPNTPPGDVVDANGCSITCPWDLDGDGNVFVTDLLLLLMDFGSCDGSPADFDGDGCVTVVDLLTLLFNFGPCPDGGCPWDVNGDGTVDKADLWQVIGNLGPCDGCPEDVNGDGIVNGQDVAAVATHFGPCP